MCASIYRQRCVFEDSGKPWLTLNENLFYLCLGLRPNKLFSIQYVVVDTPGLTLRKKMWA